MSTAHDVATRFYSGVSESLSGRPPGPAPRHRRLDASRHRARARVVLHDPFDAITRQAPIRRASKRDPVTPQVAAEVFERDLRIAGGCVPAFLGAPGDCRDRWQNIVRPDARAALTIGHVREHSGGMRRSVPRWLVSGCWGHSVQGWELANVEELRTYLGRVA